MSLQAVDLAQLSSRGLKQEIVRFLTVQPELRAGRRGILREPGLQEREEGKEEQPVQMRLEEVPFSDESSKLVAPTENE
jgi:hypothetical protein